MFEKNNNRYTDIERSSFVKYLFETENHVNVNFENISLVLNKNVLVPHPDTLEMIALAQGILKKDKSITSIADVGTGSGLIAISIAYRFPRISVYASDISKKNIRLARLNAKKNCVNHIKFLQNKDGVWLSEYKQNIPTMIISNPPFIGNDEYNEALINKYPELRFEPKGAIRSGDNKGTKPFEQMLKNGIKYGIGSYIFQINSDNFSIMKDVIGKLPLKFKPNFFKNSKGEYRFMHIKKTSI